MKDPLVVDWSDLSRRLKDSSAASDLGPLPSALPVGGQVLVANPTTWDRGETPEAYAGPVEAEAIAANQVILEDPQLRAEVSEGVPRYSRPMYPMRASLFVKRPRPTPPAESRATLGLNALGRRAGPAQQRRPVTPRPRPKH